MKRWLATSGRLVGAWIALLACTFAIVAGLDAVLGEAIGAADRAMLAWLHRHAEPSLVDLSHHVTDLGKPSAAVPLTTFGVLAAWGAGMRRDALWVLLSSVGAGGAYLVLLPLFARPRPDMFEEVGGLSMPSGHAVATLSLALPLALAGWRAWAGGSWPLAAACTLLVLLVGVTRPYIQYHYVSDVVVAWAMTAVWVWAVDRLLPASDLSASRSSSSSRRPSSAGSS